MDEVKSVKSIFDKECSNLKINSELIRKIQHYQISFVNKNSDHIEFFGGNLLGVQVVRFTNQDNDRWFEEILQASETNLEHQLITLPTINHEFFIVASNTMNISCVWLLHAIFNSPHLTDKEKHDGMIDVVLVLQYKFLTSRLYRHFPFPADRSTAEATYAQLSYKFAIKIYGSWSAVLLARAEAIIAAKDPITGKPSIHYETITKLDDDEDIRYMLNDTQGRIRDMLKNIYDVFINVHRSGERILTTSSTTISHDGVEILKDKTRNLLAYNRYINSVISDKNSFIREELIGIIEKVMATMSPSLFRMTLEWMSDNYRLKGSDEIENILNTVLTHSFDYLSKNRSSVRNVNDLPGLISKLRGVYMSSRSTDPVLINLRKSVEKVVMDATGNKNNSVVASVRTGVLLYVILRSFTMKHYS